MPSKSSDPKKRLLDMHENICLARSFVDGLEYDGFDDNQLVFYAVTRALEIISEASRRLPDEMKERHLDIPWNEIAGAEMSRGTTTRMYGSNSFGAPCATDCPSCSRP